MTVWWVGAALALIFFAVFETRAILYPEEQDTLSASIRKLNARYPITAFIMGVFVGALAIHLFG